uniref:Uncharacterized protein n=1 Tax=Lactuca sativa TaxID=4236 RepID=A0A9R1XSW8_LACSA|nr:hypothetical protein LSAT_V11C200068500 [Lactuca sativa]
MDTIRMVHKIWNKSLCNHDKSIFFEWGKLTHKHFLSIKQNIRLAGGDRKPSIGFLYGGIKDNVIVSEAIFICVEKYFCDDIDKQDQVINIELPKYKEKE